MSNRYVCVHGHFYQPPRENPSLEEIELQDSAYPYHDWNERITADCYAPNTTSRILDNEQRITRMVNNYSTISFNVGPTLLSWMEDHAAKTYSAILEADKLSAQKFGGHGSAMAQAYNHMIMPLANRRDKVTQVKWGIADFQRRFQRAPEGMWLPETAVDIETLDIMAEQGLKFTILAPRQASSESADSVAAAGKTSAATALIPAARIWCAYLRGARSTCFSTMVRSLALWRLRAYSMTAKCSPTASSAAFRMRGIGRNSPTSLPTERATDTIIATVRWR